MSGFCAECGQSVADETLQCASCAQKTVPAPAAKPARSLWHGAFALVVVSLLAAVLLPNFMRARARGQVNACLSNLKNIGSALQMYAADNNDCLPVSLGVLVPRYLARIPTCPAAGADTYSAGYSPSVGPAAWCVVCAVNNHSGAGYPSGYPRYTATEGIVHR